MNLKKIFLVFVALFFSYSIFADESALTPPSINAPKTPGTYGAQKLDWNISDTGGVSWNIPFQFPATRQLPLKLSLNYTPTSSIGEGGNFWSLSLSKVMLDKKRGTTKFLNADTCHNSMADNLYVDGTRMLPIGPGVWASEGNSGRNKLRCSTSGGFNYYAADGTIYSYGEVPESRMETADGKASQWNITKVTTFSGQGEINYTYSKPNYKTSDLNLKLDRTSVLGIGFIQDENLISIPLLQKISSDDVSATLTYEKNNFIEPDMFQGFLQVMADRISTVTILKGNSPVRSYDFEYESSVLSGRLISVKMFDTTHRNSIPREVFNYRGLPFQTQGTLPIKAQKDYGFGGDDYQFVDFLGEGTPQKIYSEGGRNIGHYYQQYDGEDIFSGSSRIANLTPGKKGQIIFTKNVRVLGGGLKDLQNATFADIAGHGALDWIDLSDTDLPSPVIFLNDFQKDANGNVIIQRGITLSKKDKWFLASAGCTKASQLKFGDFTGSGRSDVMCINQTDVGTVAILINKGFSPSTEADALPGQYTLNTQRLRFSHFFKSTSPYDPEKEIRIVDWNNDGLADIVAYSNGAGLTIFLNNGKLSQENSTENFFTPVFLGSRQEMADDLTHVAFADLTGSGLPDIIVPSASGFELYMNNGVGKELTRMNIAQAVDIDPTKLQVIDFNGNGKKVFMAPAGVNSSINVLFDIDLPSFPNMISSVLSTDGRLIHFDYSTPQMERIEAANFESNDELKNYSDTHYLLPYLFPLIKQVSISDGFNPTKVSRYAYRAPSYDKSLAKFLSFGLVRKLNVGDDTQPGQLFESRFLSGFRKSLEDSTDSATSDNMPVSFDPRLSSESSAFSSDGKQNLNQCENVTSFINSDSSLTGEGNEWCTNLAGFKYQTTVGMAQDNDSVFTGTFSSTENITTTSSVVTPSLFTDSLLQSQGNLPTNKNAFAQILVNNSRSTVVGQGGQVVHETQNSYDFLNRIQSSTNVNEAARSNDNAVIKTEYFCPGTHGENAALFCDSPSLVTKTGQGGEATNQTQMNYDITSGLLTSIFGSNSSGELKKQAWVSSYDSFGRMNDFYKSSGEHIHFDWSQTNSNLNATTDEDGIVTSAKYDDYGDVIHVENTHGSLQEFQYDSFLRLISKSKNKAVDGNLIASTPQKESSFIKTAEVFIKNKSTQILNSLSNFVASTTSIGLIQTDKIDYSFPQIDKINSSSTIEIQDYIRSLEASAQSIPDFPTPKDFSDQTAPSLATGSVTLGSVSIQHRNNAQDDLKLVSKVWLSGADEAVYSANRLDDSNFALINKSARNKLGTVYKDFLNGKINESDVQGNSLPSSFAGELRSTTNYFSDGSPKTVEFAEGQVVTFDKGANFNSSTSPEGRTTVSHFNEIGELVSKQTGSHTMNMNYDAFHRLISVTDNDGLIATQHFAANGQTDILKNNRLGLAHYFYDDENRVVQSNLCSLSTSENGCTGSSQDTILKKSFSYGVSGKLMEKNSTRFDHQAGISSHDVTDYFYGDSSATIEQGLLNGISITSTSPLGVSRSSQSLIHNEEGAVVSNTLELFLGNSTTQVSVGQYDVDKSFDLSGNLIATNTRGGLPGETLSEMNSDNVTGIQNSYLSGTNILEKVAFAQNGTITSTPLNGVVTNAEGYVTNLHLENNLDVAAAWQARKQVPIAVWAGDASQLPQDLEFNSSVPGLYHQRWEYDKDLYPISTKDMSGQQVDPIFTGNSQFSYDELGRLSQSNSDWGQIHYEYSPGGKINTVTRSGLFVAGRIAKGATSVVDIYNYSKSDGTSQDGVLTSVSSTDGTNTATLNYHSDELGFREFGVAPTLSVLASNNNSNDGPEKNDSSSWTSASEIPMQKYVWNGSGLLQGVYSAVAKDDKVTDVVTHDLLAYRMFDEDGNLLAEFDGLQMQSALAQANALTDANKLTGEAPNTDEKKLSLTKLPRLVNVGSGITYERDEIHINLDLSSMASLDLITRYPNLNATDPKSNSNVLQLRKELRLTDSVGSTSVVIDVDTKRIIERNASEPYGLERGIPLLSNSVLTSFNAQGKRADASLYQNSQGNMRDNWSEQSFESVSNTNQNEMQGMRNSEHFALGKFSAQTGIHTMGVRAYDPARGLWLSPDLYIGQSLEKMAGAGQEANLFQYAANSPTSKNDVAGMDTEEGNESGGGSYGRGSNFSNGGGGYSLGNDMEGHGPNYGMSSSYYGGQNFGSRSFSPSADKDLGNEGVIGLGKASIGDGLAIAGGGLFVGSLKTAFFMGNLVDKAEGTGTLRIGEKVNAEPETEEFGIIRARAPDVEQSSSTENNTEVNKDIIQVTPQGVALPPGRKIPEGLIDNPNRPGSYGLMKEGKFQEKLRIDPATPPGKKGPNYSHYHLDNRSPHYAPGLGNKDPGFLKGELQ